MADVYRDFVYTRNTVAVDDVGTTITVEDVSLFPQTGLTAKQDFFVTFESALSYPHTFEIMKVIKVDTALKQLEVVRGQGGTPAVPHSIATYIKGTLTGDMLRRLRGGLFGTQLPSNDADGLVTGDRFFHQAERRFYVWTGVTGQLRDSFTRPNSVTTMGATEIGSASTGSAAATATPWTNVFGVFGIDGNAGKVVSVSTARQEAVAITNPGGYDIDMSVDVTLPAAGESGEGGLVWRSDPNAMYGYLAVLAKTQVTLYRKVNGTYTQISTSPHTYGDAQKVTLRVVANANSMTIYTDGSSRLSYTETTSGFTVGTNYSSVGTNVGFRTYDNGTTILSTQSTTLRWDNFTVDHATGAVGGWQPVSESQEVALRAHYQYGTQITAITRQLDELLPIVQDDERNTIVERRDTALLVNEAGDLRDALVTVERASVTQARSDALLATTLDEIIEILKGSLSTGYGDPSGVPADGWFYLDRSSKRLWMGEGGAWTQLTFTASPGYLTPASYSAAHVSPEYTNTFTIPSKAKAGDLAFAMLATVHSGTMYTAPAGWTLLKRSLTTPYNHNNVCLVYKVLTGDDLGASHKFLTGGDTTCVVHVRTYKGSFNEVDGVAYTFGNGQPNYVSPPISNPSANSRLITWMASGILYGQAKIDDPIQENPLQTSGYGSYISQMSQDEAVAATGAAPQRGFTQTNYYTTTGWATAALIITQGAGDSPHPIYTAEGAPQTNALLATRNLVDGALYLDKTTRIAYRYLDGRWVGLQNNVVGSISTAIAARDRDYILCRPTLGVVSQNANGLTGNGTQIALTTTDEAVIFAWRGSWGVYTTTATLDGVAMTSRLSQSSVNGGSWAQMFGGDVKTPAGNPNLVINSSGTGAGVDTRAVIAIAGASPSSVFYRSSGSPSIGLTDLSPGAIVVMYAHGNGGTPPSISNAGGLTWTRHQAITSGNQNAMSIFTGVVPDNFVGTTATVSITPSTSYDIMLTAVVPGGGGPLAVVTLPAAAEHAQVIVQNDDPNGAEVRVEPTSGTINGSASHTLPIRYQGGIYTSDGTNWFLLSTGGGGSAETVTSVTAAHAAASGELVLADATTAALTVTLPAPVKGSKVTVKKTDSSANYVTLAPAQATTKVDGAATADLKVQYDALTVVGDGTNWWVF